MSPGAPGFGAPETRRFLPAPGLTSRNVRAMRKSNRSLSSTSWPVPRSSGSIALLATGSCCSKTLLQMTHLLDAGEALQ
jgi:hypothetical protein